MAPLDRRPIRAYPSRTVGTVLLRYCFAVVVGFAALMIASPSAEAQRRLIELTYTPTARAQIAIWVETGDGTFLRTFRLTEAVARRGIGNRPGATQMDSGYHWPYGRREGVLPVWGHRRLTQEDAQPFRRVIFQNRISEGFASRTSNDASRDEYYCLSFDPNFSSKETLESLDTEIDAMACPTIFNSDKGRYVTEQDVDSGYSEPFAEVVSFVDGVAELQHTMRPLGLYSLYPARRDLEELGAYDHPDAALFFQETREAMPDIDAVTMATPGGDLPQTHQFTLPGEWAMGDYVLYVEVNVEGDYNGAYWGPPRLPSPADFPVEGQSYWDGWAADAYNDFGYPYRGQPSIVYAIPFRLDHFGGTYATDSAEGYGALHGLDGEIRPLDATIANDPAGAPGSGADRLRLRSDMTRAAIRVVPTNICDAPMPPEVCFRECDISADCETENFVCYEGECLDECNDAVVTAPAMVGELSAEIDDERSWEFVHLSFTAPDSMRELLSYQVRVARTPYDPATPFDSWGVEAKVAAAVEQGLVIEPDAAPPGGMVEASMGHLEPESTYYIGVRAVDECSAAGEVAMVQVETTEVVFTTVSPCFVATATYGTPLAEEIGVLRRFRDRYLMSNAPGRALVETYYDVGPDAAAMVQEDETLRSLSRALLEPVVAFASWLLGEDS